MSAPFLAVAGREARAASRLLILLSVGLLLVAYLFTAAFPAFREKILSAGQHVGRHAPSFVRRLIEARAGGVKVEAFVALVYVHPVVLAFMTAWPVSRATQAVAGEIEKGALAWKLAYPIGRASWVLARAGVLAAGVAVLSAMLFAGFMAAFRLMGIAHAGPAPYAWAAAAGFALYTAIGMLTLWVSAASRRASIPVMAGAGGTVAAYLVENVGEMWEPLRPYRWLSLFHYADQQGLVGGAAPSWTSFAVLGAVAAVGLTGAIVTFARRDLSI